jgi:hypothetical protein
MPAQVQQYLPQIQSFAQLPEERIQGFITALANAGSKFNTFDLAVDVSKATKVPRRITLGVLQACAVLYRERESLGISLEKFLDEQVAPSLKNLLIKTSGDESGAPWIKFRTFLESALALDETLGTAAKTGFVMTEHERIFVDARVMTDIRTIFHQDVSERPNAAVLVHMLRITARDVLGNEKAQYFALDTNDIRVLKQLTDRAISKEETLTELMNNAGVTVIAPKGVF